MLRHFSSRNDDLCARHVVVWQEDHLQQVSDLVVTVHLLRYRGNQFDDSFGVVVSWGSLSTNADHSWDELASSLVSWGIEN